MFVTVSFGIGVNEHARIPAQVVSGIGFLGAGVILRDGSKIKGLILRLLYGVLLL